MKFSQNFTKTQREALADETSRNAQLLIRAGYVHKAMPGVYGYLPLGLKVLNKIENIVREGMNSIGGQEVLMSSLHPKEWWVKANRWDNVDVLFKINSQTKNEYALACSHEEQAVPIGSTYIQSYKDLKEYRPAFVEFDSNSELEEFCYKLTQTNIIKPALHLVDCVIYNSNGEVLMQKRSLDRRMFPGVYDFPGGHVAEGETLPQAIVREIKEEIGVSVTKIKSYLTSVSMLAEMKVEGDNNLFIHIFEVEVDDLEAIKLEEGKATEFKWVSKTNIPAPDEITEYCSDIMNLALEMHNQPTQYPMTFYQVQTKFRDEIRAKSGLLRGREFRMKDMYDFHCSKQSQDEYYECVKAKYFEIYTKMGLKAYATTASGGIFTTNISHEFQVEAEAGEDWIYKDLVSGEAYNEEMAPCTATLVSYEQEPEQVIQDHLLEGVVGVEALTKALNLDKTRTTKTIFYQSAKGQLIAAVVRGDRNMNEPKLSNVAGEMLVLATEKNILDQTGSVIGYAGVINLDPKIKVFYDTSVQGLKNFETGTNKTGYHTTGVCFGRDCPLPSHYYDISEIQESDTNPVTGGSYSKLRTAEVGNIFKIDDKYTKAFGATYLDKNGKPQTPIMNCYGIGTSRCMAIVAELYCDEKGLKFPESVAPFGIHLVTHINPKDDVYTNQRILDLGNKVYSGEIILVNNHKGLKRLLDTTDIAQVMVYAEEDSSFSLHNTSKFDNVLWDDRMGKVSIGEKLKDADLIGCPTQVVISKKSIEAGGVEIIDRATGESRVVKI